MTERYCTADGCGTRLARQNPAPVCWEHGGWVEVDFVSAIREFLASLAEWERQRPKQKIPKLSVAEQKDRQLDLQPRILQRRAA